MILKPCMHILASDGYFGCDGFFYVSSISIDISNLGKLFIYRVFKMLLKKGLITDNILSWRYSGFDSAVGF